MLWANSFREVKLPNGDVIHGTGDAVVFSDMLLNIAEDAPRAALMSLGGTLFVIMFAFRWRAAGWGALLTLLLGISWLVGTLYLATSSSTSSTSSPSRWRSALAPTTRSTS